MGAPTPPPEVESPGFLPQGLNDTGLVPSMGGGSSVVSSAGAEGARGLPSCTKSIGPEFSSSNNSGPEFSSSNNSHNTPQWALIRLR
jgi:hypothetical protein